MPQQPSPTTDIFATARRVTYRPEGRLEVIRSLPLAERSAVFNILSPRTRLEILEALTMSEVVELLDHLDLRQAQHILSALPASRRRQQIISKLKNDLYEKLDIFLTFHPEADLTLIHLNYVYLSEDTTVGETAEVIEDHLKHTGKVPVILINRNGKLVGEVKLTALVKERNTAKLKRFVSPVMSISYNEDRIKVADTFFENPHCKVVITDGDESVLGVVYSDDVADIFGDQPASTLYSFAGLSQNERAFDDTKVKISRRYRWMILNLATCFLAGGVVAAFNDTIDLIPLLAVYMPIVAGMGSNAAAQTAAVTLRGIALGEINLANCVKALWSEAATGLFIGAITGLLTAVVALVFGHGVVIAAVAGISVAGALLVANIGGMVVPLVLKRYGFDPASSSSIFITTATDVFSFLFLLGIATIFLL